VKLRQFSLASLLLFMLFAGSLVAVYVRREPWVVERVETTEAPGGGYYIPTLRRLIMRDFNKDPTLFLDAETGAVVIRIPGGMDHFVYPPDLRRFMIINRHGNAQVFDGKTREKICTLPGLMATLGAGTALFSSDGERVFVRDQSESLNVYDANNGSRLYVCPPGSLTHAMFSPDHSRIALQYADQILIYSDKVNVKIPCTGGANIGGFSHDGRHLLVCDIENRVWDVSSGKTVLKLAGVFPVTQGSSRFVRIFQ
jgi:hypothetical protein